MSNTIKVGLVSFTEVRDVDLVNETTKYEGEQHKLLFDILTKRGFEVLSISKSMVL